MFHYSLRVIDEPKMSEIRILNLCHKKSILVDIYRQSLLIFVVLFLNLIFLKINNQRQMSNIHHPIFTNYYLSPDGNIMNSRDREAKQSLHNDKMVLTIRTNKKILLNIL